MPRYLAGSCSDEIPMDKKIEIAPAEDYLKALKEVHWTIHLERTELIITTTLLGVYPEDHSPVTSTRALLTTPLDSKPKEAITMNILVANQNQEVCLEDLRQSQKIERQSSNDTASEPK